MNDLDFKYILTDFDDIGQDPDEDLFGMEELPQSTVPGCGGDFYDGDYGDFDHT